MNDMSSSARDRLVADLGDIPVVSEPGFKHEVDPCRLLNPGKMRSFVTARP
jgi:hypothetical protein